MLENPYTTFTDWVRYTAKSSANADINVRECNDIIQTLNLQTFSGGAKVQIIWYADYLGSIGNKLLKIIEEPPMGTYLILICENSENMLKTIVSRCQVIKVPRIEKDSIVTALIDQRNISVELASQIAHLSDGDYSLALSYTNLETNNLLDTCLHWLELCARGDFVQLRNFSSDFAKFNQEEQKAILVYLLRIIQSVIYANAIGPSSVKLSPSDYEKIEESTVLANLSIQQISAMAQEISAMVEKIERYVPGRMVMFDGSLSFAQILRKSFGRKTLLQA